MEVTSYVPIYQWSDKDPDSTCGMSYGCRMYSNLDDLYGFEGEYIVGYMEVKGMLPTENQFKEAHNIKSSAV